VAEYDAKLHEAAIKQAQLKRRERQVQDMKSQIEAEKKRADQAVANETLWRDAMERTEKESKTLVEKATAHAAHMDSRNKVLTGHWKDQETVSPFLYHITYPLRLDIKAPLPIVISY
jgi:hypothetical protein